MIKKLSELNNEDSLEVLADLIEPATKILADKNLKKIAQTQPKLMVAKYLLKNHKKPIIEVLAVLEGVPVSEYKCNIFSLPMQILNILNDEDFISFFTSQVGEIPIENFSGNVMAHTEVADEK